MVSGSLRLHSYVEQGILTTHTSYLVMGSSENFLSCLLEDKVPWYHGILPYSDFYIFINTSMGNLQTLFTFTVSGIHDHDRVFMIMTYVLSNQAKIFICLFL